MMNVYRKALETLPGNWKRGGNAGPHGETCILGHIGRHLDLSWLSVCANFDICRPLADVIIDNYPELANTYADPGHIVFTFNDRHSEEEVIAILEKAAVEFDARIN